MEGLTTSKETYPKMYEKEPLENTMKSRRRTRKSEHEWTFLPDQ